MSPSSRILSFPHLSLLVRWHGKANVHRDQLSKRMGLLPLEIAFFLVSLRTSKRSPLLHHLTWALVYFRLRESVVSAFSRLGMLASGFHLRPWLTYNPREAPPSKGSYVDRFILVFTFVFGVGDNEEEQGDGFLAKTVWCG